VNMNNGGPCESMEKRETNGTECSQGERQGSSCAGGGRGLEMRRHHQQGSLRGRAS
jgi:hypothetical protein